MSQLQGVIKVHLDLGVLLVLGGRSLSELGCPLLDSALELVSSVSEVTYSVDVEGVLSHADGVSSHLKLSIMALLVDLLAVVVNSSLEFCLKLLSAAFLLLLLVPLGFELLLDLLILLHVEWVNLSSPLPV